MSAGHCRHRPRVSPAVAVKHRQRPQIDRVAVEPEGDRIADRIQKSAAMVVHDALWIAGRAGGVVESNRIPFVLRPGPSRCGITFGQEIFIFRPAERCAAAAVVDFYERHWTGQLGQRLFDDRRELAVGDQQLRLPMDQNESDRPRIETVVQRVEHRARHRHGVVRFEQSRDVRRHDGDGLASCDPAPPQRIGKLPAPLIEGAVGDAGGLVDDGELVGIDGGGPRQESQGAQRGEIRRVPRQVRCIVEIPTFRGFHR